MTPHDGEGGDGSGSARAAGAELTTAANVLKLASSHVHRAHGHSGVVRWYQGPQES